MQGRPHRTCELLRELKAETEVADVPRKSFANVLFDFKTLLVRKEEVTFREIRQRLPEIGPFQQFEDVLLVALEVVLQPAELRADHVIVDGAVTHFAVDPGKQRVDNVGVEESFQFYDSVALEPHFLFGGNAKFIIEGMFAHCSLLTPGLRPPGVSVKSGGLRAAGYKGTCYHVKLA